MKQTRSRAAKELTPKEVALHHLAERTHPLIFEKSYFGDVKGWGVIASEDIPVSSFLLEYTGKLLDCKDVDEEQASSSYIYEFIFKGKRKCIDATKDDGSLGRLVNDSFYPNARMEVMDTYGYPHLCLFALRDIRKGEEIVYRYDRHSKLPWHEQEKQDRKLSKQKLWNKTEDKEKEEENDEDIHFKVSEKNTSETVHIENDVQNEDIPIASETEDEEIIESESDEEGHNNPKQVDTQAIHKEQEAFEDEAEYLVHPTPEKERGGAKRTIHEEVVESLPNIGGDALHNEILMLKKIKQDLCEMQECGNNTDIGSTQADHSEFFTIKQDINDGEAIIDNNTVLQSECQECQSVVTTLQKCSTSSCEQFNNSFCESCFDKHACNKPEAPCMKGIENQLRNFAHKLLKGGPVEEDIEKTISNFSKKIQQEISIQPRTSEIKEKPLRSEKKTSSKRRKFKCPYCSESACDLKRHLKSRKHGMNEEEASTATLSFGLRKKRAPISPSKRKTAQRKNKRRLCGICVAPFAKLDEHYEIKHGFERHEAKEEAKKQPFAIVSSDEDEEYHSCHSKSGDSSSSSDSTEEEEDELIISHYMTALKRNCGELGEMSDTSDEDWLQDEFDDVMDDREVSMVDAIRTKLLSINKKEARGKELDENDSEEEADYEEIDEPPQIFTSKQEDELTDCFTFYLQSRDGGGMALRHANRHKSTIQNIVRSDGTEIIDYNKLLDYNFVIEWMGKMEREEKLAGTVKTYLGSIKHFYHFLRLGSHPETIDISNVEKMTLYVTKWQRALYKDIQKRKGEKNFLDYLKYPKADEMKEVDIAPIFNEAKKCLDKYVTSSATLKRAEFCKIRDYIITNLILDNGSRPGALRNMTLEEFSRATRQKDGYVVAVMKHKNDYMGPAYTSFTPELFSFTERYMKFVRNAIPGVSTQVKSPVFVGWTSGNQMAGDLITTQFSKTWNKIQGTKSRMNPTIIRKFTTTTVHEQNPRMKRQAAGHLNHTVRVADENYDFVNKLQSASRTSKFIRKSQRTEGTSETESEFLSESGLADSHETNLDRVAPTSEEPSELPPVASTSQKHLKISCSSIPTRVRKEYTHSDNETIRKYLHDVISQDTPILKNEFENHVKSTPQLKNIYEKFGISSLIVKMRTERKNR